MTSDSLTGILLGDKKSHWLLFSVLLSLVAIVLLLVGHQAPAGSLLRYLAEVVGGALLGVAVVIVLHEFFIARRAREDFALLRKEFVILGASAEKGIENVCADAKTNNEGAEDLRNTQSLSIQAIGASWLFRGANRDHFLQLLKSGRPCQVLIPDPLSPEIMKRYEDEGQQIGAVNLRQPHLRWADSIRATGHRQHDRHLSSA
jgi:hypothetical protein